MQIIVVDVDETIIEMHRHWNDWSEKHLGKSLNFAIEVTNEEALDFWKNPNLYEDKFPIQEAVDVLTELSKRYQIIFVSHCFVEHKTSKINFIKKHFKFVHQFIDTSDKHLIHCDYIIDDRERFLIPFKSTNTTTILYKTSLESSGVADYHLNWLQIRALLT